MTTTTRYCPACGLAESIEIGIERDADGGDGMLAHSFVVPVIVSQECECELTEAQEYALYKSVDVGELEDRIMDGDEAWVLD